MSRLGWLGLTLWVCAALFSAGCGSSRKSSGTANLRVVQASPDAPQVNILVDKASVATNLAYSASTSYISVKAGPRNVQAVPAGASSPIFSQTFSISSGANQTLLLTGAAASIQPIVLSDGGTKSTTGDGYVRVVNASSAMGAADVFIVPAGTIAGTQPSASSLAFDQDTGYQLTAIGNYEVIMTTPGTTNALLSTGSIDLSQGTNQTVVALDGTSGGFTYALLTDQ